MGETQAIAAAVRSFYRPRSDDEHRVKIEMFLGYPGVSEALKRGFAGQPIGGPKLVSCETCGDFFAFSYDHQEAESDGIARPYRCPNACGTLSKAELIVRRRAVMRDGKSTSNRAENASDT